LDVARLAGVSQATVSRAFTEGASISRALRKKVLSAAQELGYQPNIIARSLTTSKTKIVGLVMGNFENPFYSVVLEELSLELQRGACTPCCSWSHGVRPWTGSCPNSCSIASTRSSSCPPR
jgi:DNA-binding LacI/PurR family transcriptional regulator